MNTLPGWRNKEAHAYLAEVEGVPVRALPHAKSKGYDVPANLTPAEVSPVIPASHIAALPGKQTTAADTNCWKCMRGTCSPEGTACPFGRNHARPVGSDPSKRGKKGEGKAAAAAAAALANGNPPPSGGGGVKQQPPDPNSKRSLKKAAQAAGGGKGAGAEKRKKAKHM